MIEIYYIALGILAGVAASVVASFIGKWISNWQREVTLNIGGIKVTVDLSDPDQIPAVLSAHSKSPQVFLAYSHKDRGYVDRLAIDLQARGLRVWYDVNEIQAGDRIASKLNEGLSTSGYVLAVLSEAFIGSEWARKEMDIAVERETRGKWPYVIPIVIDNVELPTEFTSKHYVDMRNDYEQGLNKIIDTILSIGQRGLMEESAK